MTQFLYTLPIGYTTLLDLTSALDPTQPVYLASTIETIDGSAQGQRTDHHYIMVTQPDSQNRVHYCRIPVVKLIYHNGIAFAPDYAEQLAKVERVQSEVEARLEGSGYHVRRGMVAIPRGLSPLEGAI